MVGPREKQFVDRLKELGKALGFLAQENQHFADNHYNPDLVWESKDKRTRIGFEVEFSRKGASNKKIIGDAYWLSKPNDPGFEKGFIVIQSKKQSLDELMNYLRKEGWFKEIYLIDATRMEKEIKDVLMAARTPNISRSVPACSS